MVLIQVYNIIAIHCTQVVIIAMHISSKTKVPISDLIFICSVHVYEYNCQGVMVINDINCTHTVD